MEFGVLGPITVWSDGRPVPVGGPRQLCVLGALLVHLGREVTIEQLIGYLWSDDPPRTARSVIQVQVSHLRRALPGIIATTSGGYTLDVDPDSVDLHRFRRLREAAASSDPEEAVELLERALECWRGVPFSGVGSEYLDHSVVAPLKEERWSSVIAWATRALELGRYSDVVSRLTPLITEEPFRERLHHLLITALWRDNERARALSVYEEFRSRLAEELGVDPGPELTTLHTRILQDDLPEEPDEPAAEQGTRFVVRNDLPRDLPDFTGRHDSLRQLDEVARAGEDRAQVCVITGSGGEGKTTTAVRFGYEVAKRYPDGQLFIDLYGYTPDREPLDAASALGALLRAVGVEPEEVPESLDERSALWRATLMGRRVLVVLDNAFSYAQVSPLLPSSPGSLTLVTTRNELSGLSGARFLSLGVFDERSSLELFGRVLGDERVQREQDQAREIIRVCGGLPLALRVVAGRMLSRPRWSFSHVARRLNEQNRRFRELQVEGQSVEAAIDLSYQSLNQEQGRAFLLLGLMIGSTIDLGGAAALLDMSVEDADDILQELVGMCLLEEPQGDVYRLHDLIGAFSRERAATTLAAEEIDAARLRLAEHYMATAQQAADLLGPRGHDDFDVVPSYRTELSVREDAENWFTLHQENLAETIEYFASHDNGEYAWRMADAVWRFYALHGQMGLLISSHQRALQISDKQGNRRGRAVTLIGLGIAHCLSGRFDESLRLLLEARDLLDSLDDNRGIIRALANLGMVYERVGRLQDAAEAIQGVLDYAVQLDDARLEALQWGNLAVMKQTLGEHAAALHCAERAVAKAAGGDQNEARAQAKRVMGEARIGLGELELAFQDLNEALELSLRLQLLGNQVYVHNALGVAHRAAGSWDQAVESHTEALTLAEKSGHRSGDAEIRTDLGITHAAAGRHAEAAEELERARAIAVERSERYMVARAALALGQLPTVAGDRARDFLREAEEIFTDLGLSEAARARRALDELES
ncbi:MULTISPECIES: BTAD domain-containing putative transcriptional regulator [unclassified Nocardiopsis]|uniref:AfsR/SARP family transcriptional regulator n=1 Tax=unclassified Nocardiopsis TaxID=2649073 RepID=UPI00191667B8|nr:MULTISPECIES: BTAD domain-containing putative transcriptional regulator [unclassified Nocardiopsis]